MAAGVREKVTSMSLTHSLTQRGLVIMTLNCRGLAEGSAATEQQRETYLPDTPSSSHKALSVPGLLITSCKILCVCVCVYEGYMMSHGREGGVHGPDGNSSTGKREG